MIDYSGENFPVEKGKSMWNHFPLRPDDLYKYAEYARGTLHKRCILQSVWPTISLFWSSGLACQKLLIASIQQEEYRAKIE